MRPVHSFAAPVAILLSFTAASLVSQTVNLTAAPGSATLPDGQVVPMWGLSCTDPGTAPASCRAANPSAGTGWSPVVIYAPPGPLTINLTNNLPVPAGALPNSGVPTSLVIVGQVGG